MGQVTALSTRGTSNGNRRGSSEDRRRRREWLVKTYRADIDILTPELRHPHGGTAGPGWFHRGPLGTGLMACRCYRCGDLLTTETVTVDRIVPGCMGGTYRRNNIRPACGGCNSETGGALAALKKRRKS